MNNVNRYLSLTGGRASNYTLTGGTHAIDVNPRTTNASGTRHYDGCFC